VLYSFTGGTDGGNPDAGLMRDASGNLYGTTDFGGDLNCLPPYGCGTVFKVDKTGKESVLHAFTGIDGESPYAVLIRDSVGNLYGTTSLTKGTVFKLSKTGKVTVLYSFSGGAGGEMPYAGVIRDASGNLYGTTALGGGDDDGVVFKLDKAGNETVLHTFTGTDGSSPQAPLVRDAAGNLYGTTTAGGAYDEGTVFKLDKTGNETLLYSFTGGADGRDPFFGSLLRDAAGDLYGTTWEGGDSTCPNGSLGCGVVFKLDRTGKETVLYTFTGGADGSEPLAGLVRDAAGNFYGTASAGGADGAPHCEFGCGAVFKLDKTSMIAAISSTACAFGCGTVFKLDKTGKLTVLHTFDGADGSSPYGGLVSDAKGNFYGTTYFGGTYDAGVVFKITP
jgi:uncharacterized repeat protein (TIGR03803 family)